MWALLLRGWRGGGGAEVAPISFWQSQQTLTLLCQRQVAPLARGEPSVTSARVYVPHVVREQIKEQSVLSWAPPTPSYINAALFRQLGKSFLFCFAGVKAFPFFSRGVYRRVGSTYWSHVVLARRVCLRTLQVCTSAAPWVKTVTLPPRVSSPLPLPILNSARSAYPHSLFSFRIADWISSADTQVKLCLLELSQSG